VRNRNFLIVILVSILSTPLQAQSFISNVFNDAAEAVQNGLDLIWPDELTPTDVNARFGFGIGMTPDYIGSDDYKLRVVPLVDVRYKEAWRLNGSLMTFTAYKAGDVEVGPLLALRFGRSESRNSVLAGLGDIGTTLEVGGFVRYKSKAALLSAEYRHGLGAGIGSSLRLTAGHGIYQKGNFTAMLIGRGKWLSNKSMQTNFGITTEQSSSSEFGLPAFTATSGISEITANLVGAWVLSDKVRLLALLSYGNLVGDAGKSPLVVDGVGARSQFVTGAGLVFNF